MKEESFVVAEFEEIFIKAMPVSKEFIKFIFVDGV